MKTNVFDQFVRRAVAVSRRGSFRVLGGATLASALAAPGPTGAAKAAKNAKQRCRRQEGACEAAVRTYCEGLQNCLDGFLPCCRFLATCQAGAYVECVFGPL